MSHSPNTSPVADILIVDDTPNNLRLLSTMLVEQGYKVRKALNGERALKAVDVEAPDLILLDILMPDMKGYEVCKRLKDNAETQGIPVIFISALDDPFDKVLAFDVGGADYIAKPFQVQEVLARVQHQLVIVEQQKQLQVKRVALQQEVEARKKLEADLQHYSAKICYDLHASILRMSQVLRKLMRHADGSKSQDAAMVTVPLALLQQIDESCDYKLKLIDSLMEGGAEPIEAKTNIK